VVVASSPNLVCDLLSPPTSIDDVITREVGEGELYTRPENTAKPCSISSEIDRQKEEYDSEWTTAITKKPKHRIGKGAMAL